MSGNYGKFDTKLEIENLEKLTLLLSYF